MTSRPRAGRGVTARDGSKDEDVETELLNRVIESLKKAKEYNDNSKLLGQKIIALEEEIKAKGSKFDTAILQVCNPRDLASKVKHGQRSF